MAIIVPKGLPAVETLRAESLLLENGIECNTVFEAGSVEAEELKRERPVVRIALLNLMPQKEVCETDFIRFLAPFPTLIELTLLRVHGYKPTTSPEEYLNKYYKTVHDLGSDIFDALVVTGAPLPKVPFESVRYWPQLKEIFEWGRESTKRRLYICWGAQAALKYFYDIERVTMTEKVFGIFQDPIVMSSHPLMEGFRGSISVPHSRYTGITVESITEDSELSLLAKSEREGASIIASKDGLETFVTGHLEYNVSTLHNEYQRDSAKGLSTAIPEGYYPDNDPLESPLWSWRESARLFVSNWLK